MRARKLIDMVFAADIAEKAVGVTVEDIQGVVRKI